METSALDHSRYPKTISVQKWVDGERENGLVDVKFFARHSDESTVESFSAEVLEMLGAAVIPGIKLD